MDVDVKENIPAVGDEAVMNGKLSTLAPVVAMATPRKPLMDLSQIPRPVTEEVKPSKPGLVLKPVTSVGTPLLKKTNGKKLEPPTTIHKDKDDSLSLQNSREESSKTTEATYLDKLQVSVEDKIIDDFMSQVVNKCVASSLRDQKDTDVATGTAEEHESGDEAGRESGESISVSCNPDCMEKEPDSLVNPANNVVGNLVDHSYCACSFRDDKVEVVHEKECGLYKNDDHTYCVNDFSATDEGIDAEDYKTGKTDHKFCLNKGEFAERVRDSSLLENSLEFVENTAKDSYSLMEEGEYFIDKSNVSGIEYSDTQFIEFEIEGVNDLKHSQEFATQRVNHTNQSELSDEKLTSPVCTSINDSSLTNPQGVTYLMSPKSDTQLLFSSRKGSISSPGCVKQEADLLVCSNLLTRPGSELLSSFLQDVSENLDVSELDASLEIEKTELKSVPEERCNVSVQNVPDIRSAANSPFVAHETHSAMTSPFLPYETQNISVNTENLETMDAEVETDLPSTIYVNIIKDQPEMKNVSVITDESLSGESENGNDMKTTSDDKNTNTEVIITNNTGMNTEAGDYTSVASNTDDPGHKEMSTMTETAETVNVSVETVVEMTDVGVEVQPSVETVATEMTDLPMSTVGTSMTPLKVNQKCGKRLTAEDIRKQHPRVLANEFDSLKLANERLETQVKSLEHERDRLKSLLKETKGSLTKLEKEIAEKQTEKNDEKNQIWELANRCEELETSLQKQATTHAIEVEKLQNRCCETEQEKNQMVTEHADQIKRLKEEYEETNYHDHFMASQKLAQQLQSELAEYSQLLDDLEHSQQTQSILEEKMTEGFSKVKLAEEAIVSLHRTLKARELDLSSQRSNLVMREKLLRDDAAEMERERAQTQEIVKCCKVQVEELDTQYKKSRSDLDAANTRLEDLEKGLQQSQTELAQYTEDKRVLVEKVDVFTHRELSLQQEIELLQVALRQKDEQEVATNNRLAELEDKLQNETEAHLKSKQQSDLEMLNLQHTLDSREQDIDLLEKDLFECREIICSQMERLRTSEDHGTTVGAELKSMTAENLELRVCCASLRAKEQELAETLRYTREELSATREHASRLLKEQGTEMADCSTVIGELSDHMTSVLANLTQKVGIQKTPLKLLTDPMKFHDPNSAPDLARPSHGAKQSQNSLVSLILNAAKSHGNKINKEETNMENLKETDKSDQKNVSTDKDSSGEAVDLTVKQSSDNVESPTTLSRKKLGFTGGASAFAPVRSGGIKLIPGPIASASDISADKNAEKSGTDRGKVPTSKPGSNDPDGDRDNLPDQVQNLTKMFEEINRLMVLLEKASKSALQDIRRDNEELNRRLSQCEFTERRLTSDLEYSKKELEKFRDQNADLRQKLEEMGDRFGDHLEQEAEVKRLQQELGHLRGKIQSLEAEKEFLNDQMKELLEKLDQAQSADTAQASTVDINTHKEILTLQKKVHRLKEQLQERQDFIEEISNKAARRIQKLEDNWKKADAEVVRFDELVDIIRKNLVKKEGLLKDSEEVRRIVRLIDGQESISSFRRSEKLKPVKTSLV